MNDKIDRVIVGAIETNCWLYPLEESGEMCPCVIVDPGDEAERIVSWLQEKNCFPRYIFLSHGHFDHLIALPGLIEAFEKGAFGHSSRPEIGIHRLDAHYLGKNAKKFHQESFIAVGGSLDYLDSIWRAMPDADILFEEGDTAGPFRILHIPGHTQGSVGLYDEKAGVLFSGDTLFKGDCGRSDLPGGNRGQIQESLKRLVSMEEGITVYPGHGPVTDIKEERKNNNLGRF